MRKLKGMAQGLRVIASMKKETDVSEDFTRVLAEDPPPHRPASIAGNSDGSAALAAPVRHICTKCGTTVLFPPPMQRRTCSGCGTPMCLSQDPTNPVVEDPEPSQLDKRKTEDEAGVVSKLKSWRRRSTNTGATAGGGGGGGGGGFGGGAFAGLVGKVLSNESSVSVRNGHSPTRRSTVVSRISVKLGRASVFSNATQASEVGFTVPSPKSALPEKPDFEDLLCVLLNLAAMVCSADLSDCNTVIQTFLWADAAALRTVTAKVSSGLEIQQRQVRERRGRMSTLSETGCSRLDEIVRNFIETAGEHPDAKANNEKLARKGTPPRGATASLSIDGLGAKQQTSSSGSPLGGTPNTTKGSQEFNAAYRSLSNLTGTRRPSQGQVEPVIKEDKPLDNQSEVQAPVVNRSRPNSRPTSREGSPSTQMLSLQRCGRAGSAESLGMKSIPINPDGGVPMERRVSSATDISATSFSEFHQQKKTFSFASKNHIDQLASAKDRVKALLSRTKSFGLSFSPRSSTQEIPCPEEEEPGQQVQQPLPTQPSSASRLKKGFSRGLGAKPLARGVSSVSVQSSTSKVSEAIRGLLRRQASKTACAKVGDIDWGNDGSARDVETDRRIKQSQALAKRYQRKEPKRKILQQQQRQQQEQEEALRQEEAAPHPSVPSPPAPTTTGVAASPEDRGDFTARNSLEKKPLEQKDSRGSFEMKALEPKDSRGSLENGRSSLDLKEGATVAKRLSDTLKGAMTKRMSNGTMIYGSEGDDEPIEGIVSKRSLFMFLVHDLHIPQRVSYAEPNIIQPQPVPEKKMAKLESQLSQLMLNRSMTGATDCTVPTAVLLDLALRDLDDPGSPLKQSPEQSGGLQFSSNHLAPPGRPLGPGNYGMRKALSCEVGELTDILETSTAASGSAAPPPQRDEEQLEPLDDEPEEALTDAERWRRRKEKKKKQKQDPTRASYGAILRNSYEQNIEGVGGDATAAPEMSAAGQAARNQVEQDRERLAAITGGTSRASASNAPPPSDCNEADDQSIVALGIAIPPLPRAFSNESTNFSGSSQATAENAEVRSRSSKTSDNNSVFSADTGPRAEPTEETEDAAMSKWKARKAAKAHKRKCQTKTTYGAILKMEHEQEMEFEGAEAPKPPLGQPSGLFGPAPPCGAPPPPLFGAAARDPSLLKVTAASHSESPTFGGRSDQADDSDADANFEEAAANAARNESISHHQPQHHLHQHQHHADSEDLEARLRDNHDEEERRWDAIRRAQAAEEEMENEDPSCWAARDNRYVDADAEVAAAMANAMRNVAANGRHASDEHDDSPQVSPKGSVRSGSTDGGGRSNSGNEERSANGRETNGAFPGILRRSTKSSDSEEDANQEKRGSASRGSCLSQKTVEFDFDSNEEIRLEKQDESEIESFA